MARRLSTRAVVQASVEGQVAYLTSGNPMIFDSVTRGILAEVDEGRVHIVPGLSSVDAIVADLRTDIAPGVQVFDASSLVAYDFAPQVDLPCLLLQPDLFGTAHVALGHQPSPTAISPLREH